MIPEPLGQQQNPVAFGACRLRLYPTGESCKKGMLADSRPELLRCRAFSCLMTPGAAALVLGSASFNSTEHIRSAAARFSNVRWSVAFLFLDWSSESCKKGMLADLRSEPLAAGRFDSGRRFVRATRRQALTR